MSKAAECAGVHSRLRVKAGAPVKTRSPMESVGVLQTARAEITVLKIVVAEVSAMRDEGVMVKVCTAAMPVIAPMLPTPSESRKVSDPKSDTERQSDASPKNPGHGIPARVSDDRRAVHQPRITGGHVDHFRVGGFYDDHAALRGHIFLFVAIQMASVTGLLAQGLHRVGDVLRLVDIRIAKLRGPGEVLVHIFESRGKLCDGFHARIPVLLVDFFG